ncbi:MAG: urease accessory UreF family protein [Pseudomonadota bacterium]
MATTPTPILTRIPAPILIVTAILMATTMAESAATQDALALVRIMAWLSPAFPTGAFAYSGGLEAAAQSGLVANEEQLFLWLETQLEQGGLQLDAKLLSLAHQSKGGERLASVQALASALAASAPRWQESVGQGRAFLAGIAERAEFSEHDVQNALGLGEADEPCSLSVAVGAVAAYADIPRNMAILGFLQGAVGQQLSAAIRLNLMGQTGAARLLDRLENAIVTCMEQALDTAENDLHSAAPMADLLAAQHDTLNSRLFLS